MEEREVLAAEKKVLTLIESGKVMTLDSGHFNNRHMSNNEMVAIFKAFDAFWQYDGAPDASKPHALLKSGLHSNGFIMSKAALEYPRLCSIFAFEMLKVIEERVHPDNIRRIGFVACSAYSAINLGFCLACILGTTYDIPVRHIIVEKDKDGNPTIIRGGIDPESMGLVINELMTTGNGSTWETRQAVLKSNGDNPLPKVKEPAFVLIHRSKDILMPDLTQVAPVFHFDIENFTPEECPYCKAGSKAIKPKVGNNWKLLHGLV